MRKLSLTTLVFILFLCNQHCTAQYNYVPNPSFEEYDSVALLNGDSSFYKYSYFPTHWFLPVSYAYVGYYSSQLNYADTVGSINGLCLYGVPLNYWGFTYPYEGQAMSSFLPFSVSSIEGVRNYSETQLIQPLQANHTYCVRFFITIMDTCYIAIDQIGVSLSPDSLVNHSLFPPLYLFQNPQVVSNSGDYFSIRDKWYEVSGTYTALGGERFITIGNFNTDPMTHYLWLPDESHYGPGSAYYLDMVSVIECDSNINTAYAGIDTTICLGDSVLLGVSDTTDGYSFEWLPAAGLSDSCNSNPLASPSQNTTYVLQQWYYNSFLRTDTVTVNVLDCDPPPPPDTGSVFNNVVFIPNIFSPNGDGQNDYFALRGEHISTFNIKIYNRWGLCVFETSTAAEVWTGSYKGKDCPEGVYFYAAAITFENGDSMVKNGNVTLIR